MSEEKNMPVAAGTEFQDEHEIIALRRERLKALKAAQRDHCCEVSYPVHASSPDLVAGLAL